MKDIWARGGGSLVYSPESHRIYAPRIAGSSRSRRLVHLFVGEDEKAAVWKESCMLNFRVFLVRQALHGGDAPV